MLSSNSCTNARISSPTKGVAAMKSLTRLAILAVLGQAVLMASAWILPLASEYRLVSDNISELALGRYGLLLTVALGISGLGVIGLSYAIRQLTAGARGSFLGSLLIGVYGLGSLVVAIFPTDRIDSRNDVLSQSTIGWIHSLTSLVSYFCVIVGMFILTWTFADRVRTIASARETVSGENVSANA
jgi:hypothetical protein